MINEFIETCYECIDLNVTFIIGCDIAMEKIKTLLAKDKLSFNIDRIYKKVIDEDEEEIVEDFLLVKGYLQECCLELAMIKELEKIKAENKDIKCNLTLMEIREKLQFTDWYEEAILLDEWKDFVKLAKKIIKENFELI